MDTTASIANDYLEYVVENTAAIMNTTSRLLRKTETTALHLLVLDCTFLNCVSVFFPHDLTNVDWVDEVCFVIPKELAPHLLCAKIVKSFGKDDVCVLTPNGGGLRSIFNDDKEEVVLVRASFFAENKAFGCNPIGFPLHKDKYTSFLHKMGLVFDINIQSTEHCHRGRIKMMLYGHARADADDAKENEDYTMRNVMVRNGLFANIRFIAGCVIASHLPEILEKTDLQKQDDEKLGEYNMVGFLPNFRVCCDHHC